MSESDLPDQPDFGDKFRGAMLGLAIGDALGAPFVGWDQVSRKSFAGKEHDPGRLTYTDETHLAIGVAGSLVDRLGCDPDHMAGVLLQNFGEEPWRGYSRPMAEWFECLRQHRQPTLASREARVDCAAGHVVPAGLFGHRDAADAVRLARQIAAMTVPTGWPLELSALLAASAAILVPMAPVRRLPKGSFLQRLRQHAEDSAAQQLLECVAWLLPDSPPDRVREHISQTVPPPHHVAYALYAFLRCPESFHETVYYAIAS